MRTRFMAAFLWTLSCVCGMAGNYKPLMIDSNTLELNYTSIGGTLNLTNALIYVARAASGDSPVTLDQLGDVIDSYAEVNLYGATNENPIIAGAGSLWLDAPEVEWAIETVTDQGTNFVGTFWMTNKTDLIRKNGWWGRFAAARTSGNGTVRPYCEMLYTDDDGATTNLISTSNVGELIGIPETSYRVFGSNPSDVTGTNLMLGVNYYLVRYTPVAATITTYGGGTHYTRMELSGLGASGDHITHATADGDVYASANGAWTNITDKLDGHAVGFTARLSAYQTNATAGAYYVLNFDVPDDDTEGGFNVSTYRYAFPRLGRWLISHRMNYANIDSGYYAQSILVAVEHAETQTNNLDVFPPVYSTTANQQIALKSVVLYRCTNTADMIYVTARDGNLARDTYIDGRTIYTQFQAYWIGY